SRSTPRSPEFRSSWSLLRSPHLHQAAEHLVVERLGLRHWNLHAAEPVPVAAHVDTEARREAQGGGVRATVVDRRVEIRRDVPDRVSDGQHVVGREVVAEREIGQEGAAGVQLVHGLVAERDAEADTATRDEALPWVDPEVVQGSPGGLAPPADTISRGAPAG